MINNPIRNKSIAEQKRIAEKQRETAAARKTALEQNIELKKKLLKTESDLMLEQQRKYANSQRELMKKTYYSDLQNGEDDDG